MTKIGSANYAGFRSDSHISFEGNSTTLFTNNTAYYGGAIYTEGNCYIYDLKETLLHCLPAILVIMVEQYTLKIV